MSRSFRSFLVLALSICSLLFTGTEALPRHGRKGLKISSKNLDGYTVPLSNGTASLIGPPSNLALKAITVGRGTQNYTCADSTSATKPVAVGAIATLFDAAPLLPYFPANEGQRILNLLPPYLLNYPYASLTNSSLAIAGEHFFNGAGSPVFDLSSSGVGVLVASKSGAIAAPSGSSIGPNGVGNGAVDWLSLAAKDGSSGISQAYRVETAGGKAPPTCEGQASHLEVQYAAQYWFYG